MGCPNNPPTTAKSKSLKMPPLWPKAIFDCQTGNLESSHPADIADICSNIGVATKGFGTNEDALITSLGALGPVDRHFVSKHYAEKHDVSLAKLTEEECSGDFGRTLVLLSLPMDEAEATVVRKACKGVGTDETLIISTLCGRTNQEIVAIKDAFFSTLW